VNLKIKSVQNNGDQSKEYVLLSAIDDCDAGYYLLADSTYLDSGRVSSLLRHFFWLPDKAVKKGDSIIVYTKTGSNRSYQNTSGAMTHEFYWGLRVPVWNDKKDCAVLVEAANWEFKKVVG
jgi:hypothetical protein